MGAEVPYMVQVLRLVNDVIEVSAVTADEAMQKARREYDVAKVTEAWPKHMERER